MSYEFHRGGDFYVELLDQFGNHHGDYECLSASEVAEALRAEGYLVIGRDEMATVLIAHQRMETSGCLCGWHKPGHSWAKHVVDAALAESSKGVE